MGVLIAFIFAKIGSKRVIGGFTSFMLCLLIFPVGIILRCNPGEWMMTLQTPACLNNFNEAISRDKRSSKVYIWAIWKLLNNPGPGMLQVRLLAW